MKHGRTLTEVAAELERQQVTKKDYIADTRKLALELDTVQNPILRFGTNGHTQRLPMTEICHKQIGDRVGIPARYYERMMQKAPGLLMANVNHWFQTDPETRMIRTLDNRARAFLSNRYRPLDNFDLAEVVIPILLDAGCEIASTEITDTRFYLKATTARIQGEAKKGDVIQAGVSISNSEIGMGAFKVQGLLYRLVCLNGAIMPDSTLRQHHVGRITGSGGGGDDEVQDFFSDEARQADDRAFWLKVRDVTKGVLTQDVFDRMLAKMQDAAERPIDADPIEVVEVSAKRLNLNEDERGGVLRRLVEYHDLTQYGLANAITRMSQDVASYDRATELEAVGGEVMAMPASAWKTLISLN